MEGQRTGAVCGIPLPKGLRDSDRLEQPLFTPSTKAETGHDENIPFSEVEKLIGRERAAEVRDVSLRIYQCGLEHALARGIILADTEFESGVKDGRLVWIDEALTPDSSRFWPQHRYRTGISPPSSDKQSVRDWLETQPWNKKAPAPRLPPDILAKTSEKYEEALRLLTRAA